MKVSKPGTEKDVGIVTEIRKLNVYTVNLIFFITVKANTRYILV